MFFFFFFKGAQQVSEDGELKIEAVKKISSLSLIACK